MQYALLIYGRPDAPTAPVNDAIAEVLARPDVTGWTRLHADESATTLRVEDGRTLLTDGPFVDSKEYLAGIIVIDVADLDAALEIARQAQEARSTGGGAIEVRPIVEG